GILVQLVKPASVGRVGLQENFAEADGAERAGVRIEHTSVLRSDDFGAAAADIEDQDAFGPLRPAALDTKVDEAGFLAAGDDFDRCSDRFRGASEKLALVPAIADVAGGDSAYAHEVELTAEVGHAGEYRAGLPESFL